MVTFKLIPAPIGSQFVERISRDDPDDLNDFSVYIIADANVELLSSGVSVSTASSIVSFEGENSVYRIIVRPPETAGIVTVAVAANTVSQGNPQTSKTIRVSTRFPDADAEEGILLFNAANTINTIVATPTRIKILGGSRLRSYQYDGTQIASEEIIFPTNIQPRQYLNGDYLTLNPSYYFDVRRYRVNGSTPEFVASYTFPTVDGFGASAVRNTFGIVFPKLAFFNHIEYEPLDDEALIYGISSLGGNRLYRITGGYSVEVIGRVNIDLGTTYSIYGDKLYKKEGSTNVHEIDIRPYKPIHAKTTIPIQFVNEGDRIDLTAFAPEAYRIIFDVGFKKPPYLSINAKNQLVINRNSVTEKTPVFLTLRAINYIDSQPFSFYIVISPAESPIWRDVDELTLYANTSFNLFDIVENADSIRGASLPAGGRLVEGTFTIGTQGGIPRFTAKNFNGSTNIDIKINVIQRGDVDNFSDVFRYRVEIAGIDVSRDLLVLPSVSESIDATTLNEYKINNVTLTLKSNDGNGYKYNDEIAGNFWVTNNLNAGGFRERINIYIESLVNEKYVSSLLFSGVILEPVFLINNVSVKLTAVDLASELRNTLVSNFGTLEKWAVLQPQSDEATYEGVYVPEGSLVPMQPETGHAWSNRAKLTFERLPLPSEGYPLVNTAYLTAQTFHTAGGFLRDPPILNFKGQHRSEDARLIIKQLGINKKNYQTEINLPSVIADTPFVLNHGSVSFSVEKTRITRLPTDLVYDPPNKRILILLSNPERHVTDLLVEYKTESDNYRILHTFAKNIKVHRIARRDSTNYYILTSTAVSQDRSAPTLPRPIDETKYVYDSTAAGSHIRIHHYNVATKTLTEHVPANDAQPPQLGVHYYTGFENKKYIDEFEGIVPYYRGAFKWHNNQLYYRYATSSQFGVARVDKDGTTTKLIGQAKGKAWNHLNFAFDINTSGTLYMVHALNQDLENIVVVNNQYLSRRGNTPIADNLSSYILPLSLFITFSGYPSGSGSATITIKGTDSDGNTITSTVKQPAVNKKIDGSFSKITQVSAQGWVRGNFTITASGNGTILRIRRRTSSGVVSTIAEFGASLSGLKVINKVGGTYLGAHECLFHNNYLYILTPIGRVDEDSGIYTRSRTKAAGTVLYRCNVTATNPSLTIIETYDFAQRGPCNLTVHERAVHYMEHTPAGTRFIPINPDLDGYWTDEAKTQTMGYNLIPEALGALKKINNSGGVESLGNLWYENRPYNVAATRALSIDNDLHVMMGYGNLDEVLRFNSLASKVDNVQHFVYGRNLQYVLPEFTPNSSIYASLADIATKVNATLSLQNNIISILDRRPFRSRTNGATGIGTANLNFENANKTFPAQGHLLIEKELIGYTGISTGAFTGITRGVAGTAIKNHSDGTAIIYMKHVLGIDRIIGDLQKSLDTNRIYNVIRDNNTKFEERDDTSIDAYGERIYQLSLGLTKHEKVWQKEVFKEYLKNLKDPQYIVSLTLKPTNYLRLADFIAIHYHGFVYAGQIVSITYNYDSTKVKMRTV